MGCCKTVFGGNGVALGIKIGGEDTGAGAAGQRGMHEADGALADDQNGFVGAQVQHLHTFENGVDRLDEGGLLKGHAVGNADDAAAGAIQSITRIYSAKPPPDGSKPAVTPTFL